jgi:hypothetical protein
MQVYTVKIKDTFPSGIGQQLENFLLTLGAAATAAQIDVEWDRRTETSVDEEE